MLLGLGLALTRPAGAAAFRAPAVTFDGTNDWLSRDSDPAGLADGKQGLISLWFKPANFGSDRRLAVNGALSDPRHFDFYVDAAGKVILLIYDAGGNLRVNYQAKNSNLLTAGAWHHIAAAWDVATPGASHLIIDGVDDTDYFGHVDATLDVAEGNGFAIGATKNGDRKSVGDFAEVYLAFGQYLDLSQAANLQKFRSAAGKPVSLGATGAAPTGSQPTIYLSGDAASFAANAGAGGAFTVNGALADAATSPSD